MCHLSQCARQKCGFLAKEIPNYTQELEHNPPHVMIWTGVTPDYLRIIGPYFLDGPVKAASYSAMLETWLIPQLIDRGLLGDVWLQHDGATVHFTLSVRDVLNEHFPGRWIGRGSPTSPSPLPWPPRSADLTTTDNSLWCIMK
jgi:hypothetical protein